MAKVAKIEIDKGIPMPIQRGYYSTDLNGLEGVTHHGDEHVDEDDDGNDVVEGEE